ncbi:hypothetical protein [Methylobacterium sp. J-076]|uniref:hypothetical protein n=1 Tax=Methylobacterium sp. J-076 TaxID=2836655 RepID=UPI001FBA4244|nr:hypothetical protein [Methylobacterium sp. J-076]MCJ2012757.1 hypothetical protein [Methylobacterium sp. J-076]
MRPLIIASMLLTAAAMPACAQDKNPSPAVTEQQPDPSSDSKQAEIKERIEAGRKKQDAFNAKAMGLWTRWTYAVCIGCGVGEPKNTRIVHTTPSRVLAGIPAAEDDARELAMARRTRRL